MAYTRLRHYETVIIVHPDATESQQNTIRARVDQLVGNAGGRVARWETWGRRRLAYPIQKQQRAWYLYVNYVCPPKTVHKVEANLRVYDPVMRYQTVRLADAVDPDAIDFEALAAERTPLYVSPDKAANPDDVGEGAEATAASVAPEPVAEDAPVEGGQQAAEPEKEEG